MMGIAWLRTRRDVPLGLGRITIAGAITLFGPPLVGILLALIGGAISPSQNNLVFGTGFVVFYSVMFSWAGLLPGMALHWGAWRLGWGGFLPCLALATALGLLLAEFVGPLAWIFGIPLAAIYWWTLRWLSPGSFRPAAVRAPSAMGD
ncbi:hypothetical protein [Pseudooceanicola sp.]|uniref:hypothetical protein n=1 Tax=Pseudooceanicola sp. TaxID=1914328 RepID=UPI0035C6B8CC